MAHSSWRHPYSHIAFFSQIALGCALILAPGCAGPRRQARTSPEPRPLAAHAPSQAQAQTPSPEPAQTQAEPSVEPTVDAVLARAQEFYDQGLEALQAGEVEKARENFDAAVTTFLKSEVPVSSSVRLQEALDKMVDDIAALEADLDEPAGDAPDAEPSPVEELKDINTDLTPEQVEKEMRSVAPEARDISFDIPMVVNEKVLSWIEVFKTKAPFRKSFIGGYERYGWYEQMIHRIFREEGLPDDLIYMAFLESTYKTSAYSRARAKGIWQFMTPTGRQYGLKVNRYVDERSHPEKATRAAARYMKDLYATFGDWHLAIAAYNTGAGNIMRAQRRSGKTSFWDLAKTRYMRTETKNFVPAILALALMAKDPAKHGFEGLQHNPTLQYDHVTVAGPTKLSLVARLSGVDEEEIRFLNPHLRLGVTPPGERDYELLVPQGRGDTFTMAYASLPEQDRRARLDQVHVVRRGETLATIAGRYGTTVRELCDANSIRNPHRISVGTELTVPVPGGTPVAQTAARRVIGDGRGATHTVRRGDTLSEISRTYGVSVRQLMGWNGINEKTVLRPGSRLAVGPPASTRSESAGLVSVPGGGQAPPDPTGEKVTYKVRRGDNLFRIALRFRTSVENLKVWNNISGDAIRAGELLTILPN
ncbi:MAG TPA: LysM peptidoglycan-binding domain-containing protein [Candidatus Polarisedimenticolia bacterium]|nr:LysM peptidoglycan-binding domain-containing protein [Candidatus Polarisedimenticolia bacterium]